jgi:hypothetical protein
MVFNDDCFARIALHFHRSHLVTENYCVGISHEQPDQQLSSLEHVCTLFLPSIFTVGRHLHLRGWIFQTRIGVTTSDRAREYALVRRLFTAVKKFYISKELTKHVAPAL